MSSDKISIFWFRRDLRFEDNTALYYALKDKHPVLPLFIFDRNILDDLDNTKDARVTFIYDTVKAMHNQLAEKRVSMLVNYGKPKEVYQELIKKYNIAAVYTNRDYEPYAKERDETIEKLLAEHDIEFNTFKDQVIFEKDEILSNSGDFYKVFTPYKKAWLEKFKKTELNTLSSALSFENWHKTKANSMLSLQDMNFERSDIEIPKNEIDDQLIKKYEEARDYPAREGTSRLGVHLRFGTISIRKLVEEILKVSDTFLSELIWREFYMQILHHNPQVVDKAFKPKYDKISWRNNEDEFQRWCEGKTGYPIVDAGMRELNTIGYMHNRVRMITASFLTKHLLIDWRWGEAYFASKLLDYELANNNGGWQWAAGSGVDAQPYFRIFNPYSQTDKFDKDREYIKKWVPEVDTDDYPEPMVDHKEARERALKVYKKAVSNS
ncbi:deoxyribodipyrimidine photo-lyase [Porifericola rhodea]|uniref:cryptochrome/photolyase family protein n=1 Tax=Porifericola rhodea TaxID=930972 RepID=UPI0026670DD8|nr:deoxyribodipyrimidine photo-lyase [Porifericola rhodea]WKN33728.1 deoxyribodipyrimidine photo-lyase [Porifericola rhodea]